MRGEAQRRRARWAPANPVRIDGDLVGIEMLPPFAFRLPQLVEKNTNPGQRLRLPRFHLRTRPVNSIDLRLGRGKRAEVLVFGRVRQLCIQTVLLYVGCDLVVPGFGLRLLERPADDASPAV